MNSVNQMIPSIHHGDYDNKLQELYAEVPIEQCRKRYQDLPYDFNARFEDKPEILVSAYGSSKVRGNHTDHQNGNVLACLQDSCHRTIRGYAGNMRRIGGCC